MENIEKLALGVLIFVITSVIAYLFRMRQLYVVAPKLYKHAPVSKNGSLCEIIVFNKGNQVEENIQVDLDPDLKCELLASSTNEIQLNGSSLKIERLHKGCEGSAILLIENGILEANRITSITSKGTKGSVIKKITDVPPNFAHFSLLIIFMLGVIPSVIYGEKGYSIMNNAYIEYKLQAVVAQGWSNLSTYYSSDIKQSYSNQEFPIKYIDYESKENGFALRYEVYNKTSLELEITARPRNMSIEAITGSGYFSYIDVPPMSKEYFVVKVPRNSDAALPLEAQFTFKAGEEFIHQITNTVKLSKQLDKKKKTESR